MYGAIIPPTRAIQELEPIPAFRTTVGKSSAEYKYTIRNAADAPSFPTIASTVVIILESVNIVQAYNSITTAYKIVLHILSYYQKFFLKKYSLPSLTTSI